MNEQMKQSQWKDFLNDFSRRNELRPARLEILSNETGAGEEAKHLPLIGISYEEKGSEAGDAMISFGGGSAEDTRHITHTIKDVVSITPSAAGDGNSDALEITGANGEKAILQFEQPLEIEAKTSAA